MCCLTIISLFVSLFEHRQHSTNNLTTQYVLSSSCKHDSWKDDDRRRDFDDDGCGPGRAFKKSSSNRSGCKPSASTKRAVKRNRNRRRRCNGRYCDSSVSEDEDELTETATTAAPTTTKANKEERKASRAAEKEARKADREANRSSKATKSPSAFYETETAIA